MSVPLRALIIEDNLDDCELVALHLTKAGYDVDWLRVETLDEVVTALHNPWDVVLSDYRLPTFAAEKALKLVREIDPLLPFIVISGTIGEDAAVDLMRLGANDYVFKENLLRLVPALRREIRDTTTIRRGRQKAELLEAIVDSTNDAIFSECLIGRVTTWNPAAEKLFGLKGEAIIGQRLSDMELGRFNQEMQNLKQQVWEKARTQHAESELRNASGSQLDVSVTVSPIWSETKNFVGYSAIVRDISEEIHIRRERQQTEILLRAVADNTPDAIFVKDLERRYLFFNEAASRVVGIPSPEVIGKTDFEIFNRRDSEEIQETDQQVLQEHRVSTREETLTNAQGERRVFMAQKAPYWDEKGNVIGLIGISRDITDLKKTENALRESESRFRAFMSNSPALEWIADSDGYLIFVNNRYSEKVFLNDQEPVGKHIKDIFPEELAQDYLKNNQIVLETGEVHETLEDMLDVDGKQRKILVYKFPLPMAGKAGLIGGIAIDVTDRIEMEKKLHLRNRAIESLNQGLLITDPTQTGNPIIYVNSGFEKTTGYAQHEVVGKNCSILHGEETDPATVRFIREQLKQGVPFTTEILNYRKDGTTFWNELSIAPVHDDDGKLTHFIAVQTVVTRRRELEEQLRHSQKIEAIGRLAGGVAHDFNNILSIIYGYCELASESVSKNHPAKESLEAIRDAGERAANLTKQLLTFARRQMRTPELLDLNQCINSLKELLHRTLGGDVQLETQLAEELPPIRADQSQIEQILMNLSINARDAMPEGGRLHITTESALREDLQHEGMAAVTVLLKVSDTGTGIPEELVPQVFEPFFTTKDEGKGTGLGLSVVYGIVEQTGGRIELQTKPGEGTTFIIEFPVVDDSGSPANQTSPIPTKLAGHENILLVEDESSLRQLTKSRLESFGYHVYAAGSGEEAEELIRYLDSSITIDLLITDVVMPGRGGRQVAQMVKTYFPNARVLFISGYVDDQTVQSEMELNNAGFLEKPFTSTQLANTLRSLINSSDGLS